MMNPYNESVVQCGDCLAIAKFTVEKHNEEEFCQCGGQWCGCGFCQDFAKRIFDENQQVLAHAESIDAATY